MVHLDCLFMVFLPEGSIVLIKIRGPKPGWPPTEKNRFQSGLH
jgi:hypothetical protein